VVLSTQKNVEGFFNTSGRLGEDQPLKIPLAVRSFNLSGPCHLIWKSSTCGRHVGRHLLRRIVNKGLYAEVKVSRNTVPVKELMPVRRSGY